MVQNTSIGATTSAWVTGASKKATKVILDWVCFIHYSIQICNNKEIISALIDFNSEINVITPTYAKKLGLQRQTTKVKAQKIERSSLDTFKRVIAGFQVINKLAKA